MKKKILMLIFITVVIKIILLYLLNNRGQMNPDEEFNYHNAALALDKSSSPEEKFISFHGYAPVLVYGFLLSHNITKEAWVLFVYAVTLALFVFSIFSFYKLSFIVLSKEKLAFYATVTYCLYPSVLYYIGGLFYYENFVLPLMVIIMHKLVKSFEYKFSFFDYLIIPVGICVSCLFRAQVIIVYFAELALYIYLSIKKKKIFSLLMIFFIVASTFSAHIPILMKNKAKFGAYILSTQYGYELLQGHNPSARGSWMAGSLDPANALYQYVHKNIKNVSSMDEYQESEARKHLALKWIKENPFRDLQLEIKKMAIFFYPANFEVLKTYNWFNPVNFFVHFLFVLLIIVKIFRWNFSTNDVMILSPITGSIFLTIIFFTGYRWRYYAEPFMIIFAWQFLQSYVLKKKRKFVPNPKYSVHG